MNILQHNSTFSERHYRVGEVAFMWGVSDDWVRRRFENERGVVALGHRRRGKRVYKLLLIPESVLKRVYATYVNAGLDGQALPGAGAHRRSRVRPYILRNSGPRSHSEGEPANASSGGGNARS